MAAFLIRTMAFLIRTMAFPDVNRVMVSEGRTRTAKSEARR